MKKKQLPIAVLLSCVLLLSACGSTAVQSNENEPATETLERSMPEFETEETETAETEEIEQPKEDIEITMEVIEITMDNYMDYFELKEETYTDDYGDEKTSMFIVPKEEYADVACYFRAKFHQSVVTTRYDYENNPIEDVYTSDYDVQQEIDTKINDTYPLYSTRVRTDYKEYYEVTENTITDFEMISVKGTITK